MLPLQPSDSADDAPISPCVGICRIGADGCCLGCWRTLAEIAGWHALSDAERRRWMREELPRRRPARP